jgi:nucleoside-diphosphate-sugar epimerase
MGPTNERELEEILSRPGECDRAAMRELEGDLLILGAGGKMGPSLARRARRAASEAGVNKRIIAVARFSEPGLIEGLADSGVETIRADLLEQDQLDRLPDCANVIFMAARKFGTTGNEHMTWAMNTLLPARVAERYKDARIVAFSTGNVYPLMPVHSSGATEAVPVAPVGEYAQSALGRERMFQYCSSRFGTRVTLLRLNYAIDLRYGVLSDIGRKVFEHQPVDLSMGYVNVIWQGDANSVCLRSFNLCQSPPSVLNLTGSEVLSVRSLALRCGEYFGIDPIFKNTEGESALLSDASDCRQRFGDSEVGVDAMIRWTADWIRRGGRMLNKPTHFQVRNGRY